MHYTRILSFVVPTLLHNSSSTVVYIVRLAVCVLFFKYLRRLEISVLNQRKGPPPFVFWGLTLKLSFYYYMLVLPMLQEILHHNPIKGKEANSRVSKLFCKVGCHTGKKCELIIGSIQSWRSGYSPYLIDTLNFICCSAARTTTLNHGRSQAKPDFFVRLTVRKPTNRLTLNNISYKSFLF